MRLPFNESTNVALVRTYRRVFWPRDSLHSLYLKARNFPVKVEDADLTVEGFGRSGNTFAVTGLEISQVPPLKIASHYHYPVAVSRSVKAHVPVCLLLRNPVDSIASYCQYSHWPPRRFVEDWIDYHRILLPYLDDVCVCRFEDFSKDFNVIIDAINKKHGMTLTRVDDSGAFTKKVFEAIEGKQKASEGAVDELRVHRPSEVRANRKPAIVEQIRRDCAPLMRQVEDLYQRYAERGTPPPQ